jgi:uncharacterized protein YciI
MKLMPSCLALTLLASGAAPADEPIPNMEKYYVVLLKRAPNAPKMDEPALEALQKKHLGHLRAMFEAGKMVIAGPFDEQQDQTIRGMCIYRVATIDEARKLAEQDPMVLAGRLRVEVLAWWVEKGFVSFKAPPAGK